MAKSDLAHLNEPVHVKKIWNFNFKTVWPLILPLWPLLAFLKVWYHAAIINSGILSLKTVITGNFPFWISVIYFNVMFDTFNCEFRGYDIYNTFYNPKWSVAELQILWKHFQMGSKLFWVCIIFLAIAIILFWILSSQSLGALW